MNDHESKGAGNIETFLIWWIDGTIRQTRGEKSGVRAVIIIGKGTRETVGTQECPERCSYCSWSEPVIPPPHVSSSREILSFVLHHFPALQHVGGSLISRSLAESLENAPARNDLAMWRKGGKMIEKDTALSFLDGTRRPFFFTPWRTSLHPNSPSLQPFEFPATARKIPLSSPPLAFYCPRCRDPR